MISRKSKLTTVKFGYGTVGVSTERKMKKGVAILDLYCVKPNQIGSLLEPSDRLKLENIEMTFKTCDSIDILIENLNYLKHFLKSGN